MALLQPLALLVLAVELAVKPHKTMMPLTIAALTPKVWRTGLAMPARSAALVLAPTKTPAPMPAIQPVGTATPGRRLGLVRAPSAARSPAPARSLPRARRAKEPMQGQRVAEALMETLKLTAGRGLTWAQGQMLLQALSTVPTLLARMAFRLPTPRRRQTLLVAPAEILKAKQGTVAGGLTSRSKMTVMMLGASGPPRRATTLVQVSSPPGRTPPAQAAPLLQTKTIPGAAGHLIRQGPRTPWRSC
mmetsp:Transcript_69252/g.196231  ORF Transcript_69252/g.196231 Transcript_69252/m.196231 type:complete len:246 (-) Transcript_69252:741-1478(-)